MKNEDIEILNKLFEIAKKILKIYNNLIDLELNNKKNTDEYKKQLDILDICLGVEENLYKKIDLEKIDDYIEYSDYENLFTNITDYDLLVDDIDNLLIYKRVYNKLNKIKNNKLINDYQDEKNKNDYPPFDLVKILESYINNDIFKSLILLIDNSLNDNINKKYINRLIKSKYLISFLNTDIENDLKESVEVNNYLIIRYLATSDNEDIKDICNKLLHEYYLKYIKIHINNLIHIKDNDYQDDFQKIRSIILELIIRAFLDITPPTFNNSNSYDIVKIIEKEISLNNKNEISAHILKKLLIDIKVKDNNTSLFRLERMVSNENSK